MTTKTTTDWRGEREAAYRLMTRCGALGERITAHITKRIQTPGPKTDLDKLFDLGHQQFLLYMRFYARYQSLIEGNQP